MPSLPKPAVGMFRNVTIDNVVATGAGATGCAIVGLPDHPIQGVSLSNIRIAFVGGGTAEQAGAQIPELEDRYPECTMFGALPAYGFFCRHVDGLTFSNVTLQSSQPDARPPVVLDDVREFRSDALCRPVVEQR